MAYEDSKNKYDFSCDPEPLLATLSQLFSEEGAAREVAILVNSQAVVEQIDYDNWDGGTYFYAMYLQIPAWFYQQMQNEIALCESKILEKAQFILLPYPNDVLRKVRITPSVNLDKDWKDKTRAWLTGTGVTNQGRVRSTNVAARTCDGLLFRSQHEILLYKALKLLGVSFAPLPVFIRGGENYRRIEPDFVILKDGILMIVEVDGDTVHHETPAEAHARTTMLVHEGAHVERIRANDCDTPERAAICAKNLLQILNKLKSAR